MSETTGELGLAPGVAAFGSLGTAVYRYQIGSAVPADAPLGAAKAARETLAGATAATVLVYAVLAVVLLRHVRPSGGAEAAVVSVTNEEPGQPGWGMDPLTQVPFEADNPTEGGRREA